MSVALTGFMTGFARGAKERVEKEREENEAIIANRLKMAQTNRLLYKKEQEAQKQLYKTRYEQISAYVPPEATEEQKLALISNEEIAKQFTDMRSKGEEVDLNKFLVVNKDKIPKTFSTVQQYLDSIDVAPAPVGQDKVDAIRQTEGAFGARVGANVEKIAQQYGASAGELLAYEEKSGVPVVPQFARMNVGMLKNEKSKDVDTRITQAQSMYLDAREEFGPDSQEAKVAKAQYDNLKLLKNELEPEQVKWADYVGKLKMAIVNAKTPQERAAAQQEYNKVIAIEKQGQSSGDGSSKIPTANTLIGILTKAGTRAVTEKFGGDVAKNLIVDTAPDGITSFRYIGTDPVARAQVLNTAREAMRYTVQMYLDMNGRPQNRDVEVALRAQGIQFNEAGTPVFDAMPVPDAPATPPRVPAGRGTARNPPPAASKTRTRAQVEAVAKANGVSYEEAAAGAKAQGYTIID